MKRIWGMTEYMLALIMPTCTPLMHVCAFQQEDQAAAKERPTCSLSHLILFIIVGTISTVHSSPLLTSSRLPLWPFFFCLPLISMPVFQPSSCMQFCVVFAHVHARPRVDVFSHLVGWRHARNASLRARASSMYNRLDESHFAVLCPFLGCIMTHLLTHLCFSSMAC